MGQRHCCKMSIPGHDKMSSRVVPENGAAACSKVMDNILLRRSAGGRKSRDRETSRPIPWSRILPHSARKTKESSWIAQRGRPAIRKTQNSSERGRGHFCPNLNERNSLLWHPFISAQCWPRNVVLGKTKESYSTVWTTRAHCPLSRC